MTDPIPLQPQPSAPVEAQPRTRRKRPFWLPATGRRATRAKKAKTYLRSHAWVPGKPEDRHAALFIVMGNLRRYHRLPVDLALSMVQEHYNPRCMDAHGTPQPYPDEEILNQYRRAGMRGVYPTLGVSDPRAVKAVARKALQKEILRFVRKHLASGGSCTPATVRDAFIAFRGGVSISAVDFGRELAALTGIRRRTPFGVPTYPGVHLVEPIRRSRKAA